MCGYFGNLHECPAVIDLMNQLNLPLPYPVQRAYQRRPFDGLVYHDGHNFKLSKAIWWFALKYEKGRLVPNDKITSFNARDLDKPLWSKAMRTRRAVVFATELGESNGKDKYLMRSDKGFALGCLYREWETEQENLKSFAVITRPPHDRFSTYHKKAFPLFIPLQTSAITTWLTAPYDSPELQYWLNAPRLTVDLSVTQVKTYKDAVPLSTPEILKSDDIQENTI